MMTPPRGTLVDTTDAPEQVFNHYIEVRRVHVDMPNTEAGSDEFYVATLLDSNDGRGVVFATFSASFCDLDETGASFDSWLLYFLGNTLLDIGAYQTKRDRNMFIVVKGTRADGLIHVYLGEKPNG